jgi:hypothetical protein
MLLFVEALGVVQGNISHMAEALGDFVIAGAEHGVFEIVGIAHNGLEALLAKGDNTLGRIANLQSGICPALAQKGHIGAGYHTALGVDNAEGTVRNLS